MKVALTGASGFVGGRLARALVERGDSVRALVRSRQKATPLEALGCEIVAGGLEDARALRTLLDGRDVVYHVAGLVAARGEQEFLAVNRDGAARVAAAVRDAGAGRMVLVSSLAVTGPSRPGECVDERSPPRPLTSYGRSKHAGEEAARASGAPLTIVRPPAVYGPGDRAFLTLFRAAKRGLVPLLGDGSQQLTLVHVDDLCRALVAVAASPRTLGRTYHAGHEAPVSQLALAQAIGRAVGRRVRCLRLPASLAGPLLGVAASFSRALGAAPLLDRDKCLELFAPGWVCSSEALRRETGWAAEIALEEGLARTARGYRERGWL